MTERLRGCARTAEELVALLLELAELLGPEVGHGGRAHEAFDRLLERAVALRSDLRRLERYGGAAEPE